METLEFDVRLRVRVEAPSVSDAFDLLNDTFGEGEECGVEVTSMKIESVKER